MSDAITTLLVQIKGDATSAVQALKDFATASTTASTQVNIAKTTINSAGGAVNQLGKQTEQAGAHIKGLTYYFRSGMDSIRFALMGGSNPMAAFYAMDEGIRALVASGMEIGTLVPVIGGLVAVVGAGALAWHEWNAGEREAAKNAKDLKDAWKDLPGILTQLNEMQQAGVLSAKQAGEYGDIAAGRKKMYWDGNHQATALPTRTETSGGGYTVSPEGVPIKQPVETSTVPNTPMTRDEQGQYAIEQASAGGTITKEWLDAVKQSKEEIAKANEEALAGLEKQKAEIRDKYEAERQEMANNLRILTANMSEAQIAQSKVVSDLRQAMTQKGVAEQEALAAVDTAAALKQAKQQEETLDKLRKDRTEELRQIDQAAKTQAAADKQHEDELRRQAELNRDISRGDIESQIEAVKSNPLMLDEEKLQIVSKLQDQLKQVNNAEIAELEALKSQAKSLSDQLELEKKIADLKHQNAQLSEQTTPEQHNSFGFQFGSAATDIQNKWTGWATESAKAFQNTWQGATNGVSAGLTHLFEYGAQKGQWFREMWNGVVGSMISSFTQMAVSWVMNHVVMEVASVAFYEVMKLLGLQDVAAKILGDQMKVVSHITGETTATTATIAGVTTRIGAHAAAAGAGAAESEASIPYVGPILAVAAMGAIVAAVMALAHGFKEGGYTGAGHPSQVAGVVHAGEWVTPANRVGAAANLLQGIHSGSITDAMMPHAPGAMPAPSGQGGSQTSSGMQINTSHYIYTDKAKMARAIEQDDAHAKWVVDTVAKSSYKA